MLRRLFVVDSVYIVPYVDFLESDCFTLSLVCHVAVGLWVEVGVCHWFPIGSSPQTPLSSNRIPQLPHRFPKAPSHFCDCT